MTITVEETMLAGDQGDGSISGGNIPQDLLPHMIYREVILGTRKRTPFIEAFEVTTELVGAMGIKISVGYVSTGFTASTRSESTLDTSGYSDTELTVSDVDITIGDQVYVASRISDVLREDQPRYNWVRIMLQEMGKAIAEYVDAALRDVLIAGAGNTQTAATAGTLALDDVMGVLALMKNDSYFPEDGTPFLFSHPDQELDLLKDTRYHDTKRYQMSDLPMLAANREAPEPLYASCRVRVTDNMTPDLALVVMPPTHKNRPIAIHALKRRLTVKSDREEYYGRELWVTSTRYGSAIIRANGVGLITNC